MNIFQATNCEKEKKLFFLHKKFKRAPKIEKRFSVFDEWNRNCIITCQMDWWGKLNLRTSKRLILYVYVSLKHCEAFKAFNKPENLLTKHKKQIYKFIPESLAGGRKPQWVWNKLERCILIATKINEKDISFAYTILYLKDIFCRKNF